MNNNAVTDTINGSGIILKDVGINIVGCKIERNNDDGITIDCQNYTTPARVL